MKVLHIISSYKGGIYSFIKSKLPYLTEESIHSDVLAFEDPSDHQITEIQSYNGQYFKISNPKQSSFTKFKETFKNILSVNQYDVIHCHLNGHRAFLFYLIARRVVKDTPFVIHAHNTKETTSSKFKVKSAVISKIDRVINSKVSVYRASCSRLASEFIFTNESSESITLLPNSINESKYSIDSAKERTELRKMYKIEDDFFVVGQIGRLDQNKNHRFTIELATFFKQNGYSYKWVFIGEGQSQSEVARYIEENELQDDIILLGRKEPIQSYYSMMDAIIHPSISEGFGIVPVEAQASGKPTLVSDTLTRDIDLRLGLVTFLPLTNKKLWLNKLLELQLYQLDAFVTDQHIADRLNAMGLTDKRAAQLYINFLKKIA